MTCFISCSDVDALRIGKRNVYQSLRTGRRIRCSARKFERYQGYVTSVSGSHRGANAYPPPVGKMMPLDICSVTQGDKRRFSFMSVAMGLMCDVDLGEWFSQYTPISLLLTNCSLSW
jgi:hypothetical protein